MTCTVVIATRNRKDDLRGVLESLDLQTDQPLEVLIVDASDPPIEEEFFRSFETLRIRAVRTLPSLCKQRNTGIRLASGDVIFLCDDDMEIPADYVRTLLDFLNLHPDCGAVSGTMTERWGNGSLGDFPTLSPLRLIWNSLFLLSIWSDLNRWRPAEPFGPLLRFLQRRHARSPNRVSAAGWPRLTHVEDPIFRTQFYGLGASMVRRELLLKSPYDEILDESGIGDPVFVPGFALPIHIRRCLKRPGRL